MIFEVVTDFRVPNKNETTIASQITSKSHFNTVRILVEVDILKCNLEKGVICSQKTFFVACEYSINTKN